MISKLHPHIKKPAFSVLQWTCSMLKRSLWSAHQMDVLSKIQSRKILTGLDQVICYLKLLSFDESFEGE